MRRGLLSTALLLVLAAPAFASQTWYVRADGGTRYSTNETSGQCNGQYDAPYPGSGVNQNCAFNNVQFLWQDGSETVGTSFPGWGWVIAGGDTVVIRNGPWRLGWPNGSSSQDTVTGLWFGNAGDPFGGPPAPPSGTLGNPTQILGENYANCTASSGKTQLYGGFGAADVINLQGANNVNVECLELTKHGNCIRTGSPVYPTECVTSPPLSDYAQAGVFTDANTYNILLQDLNIHGFTGDGITGAIGTEANGGLFTVNRVRIAGNGDAGWDFAYFGENPPSYTNLVANQLLLEWNGCNEEYPIVDTYPAISCYDDLSEGFGDGWSAQGSGAGGTQSGLSMTMNNSMSTSNGSSPPPSNRPVTRPGGKNAEIMCR